MMIRLLDIAAIADECKGKPITYHEDGSLASKTDKRGFTWSYVYDSLGNLVRAIDHLGNETLLSYDGAGNITVTEDPLGNVTTYDFDAMNRLTCRTDAQGNTTSYTYQRCNLGRPVAQHLADRELSYAWDPEGNLVGLADHISTMAFEYDALDRRTAVITSDRFFQDQTIAYTFNKNSLLTEVQDPLGGVTRYAYDDLNRLTTLTNYNNENFSFQYDALNRMTRLAFPNGVATQYTYDAIDRVTSISSTGASDPMSHAYTYDKAGNIVSWTKDGQLNTYGYDGRNWLTRATRDGEDTSYSYDSNGNRLLKDSSADTMSYSYAVADRLSEDDDFAYQYDARGRTVRRTSQSDAGDYDVFVYDASNRMTGVERYEDYALVKDIEYVYDPLDRRIAKVIDGAMVGYYLYQGDNAIAIVDAQGVVLQRITNGLSTDNQLALELDTDHDGSLERLTMHKDHLGSIAYLADSSGSMVQQYEYDEFGNIQNMLDPNIIQPFTYTGREFDPESGLYYYRARYYEAGVGRFLGEDQVSNTNIYLYTENNPTNVTDPSGLINVIAGAGGTVTGITGGEASGGIFVNPGLFGQKPAAGGFASVGGSAGLNISGDVFIGVILGDAENIEGSTVNTNISIGPISISAFFNPQTGEFVGGTIGIGPSATTYSASTAIAETGTTFLFGTPTSQENACSQ